MPGAVASLPYALTYGTLTLILRAGLAVNHSSRSTGRKTEPQRPYDLSRSQSGSGPGRIGTQAVQTSPEAWSRRRKAVASWSHTTLGKQLWLGSHLA